MTDILNQFVTKLHFSKWLPTLMPIISKKPKLSIIGLGYVGLPLAVEFGKKFTTIGFDICLLYTSPSPRDS